MTRISHTMTASILALACLLSGVTACSDLSGLGKQKLPAGTPDPNSFKNPDGAMALYRTAVYKFQYVEGGFSDTLVTPSSGTPLPGAFVDYMITAGLVSDEFQAGNFGSASPSGLVDGLDSADALRMPEGIDNYSDNVYTELHTVRAAAGQAIGALAAYAPDAPSALRGHLYALEGYAELFLADLFCSGVPLSTLDFDGDYTYRAGSKTVQVYQDAAAKFDTAIALSADSINFLNLARVGKGRALLAQGDFAAAAAAVADVPDDFVFQFAVDWAHGGGQNQPLLKNVRAGGLGITVSDVEGINGLRYRTSSDARTATTSLGNNSYGRAQFAPTKYAGTNPIVVASGVEARLIEAEADLRAGGTVWLSILNAVRTDGSVAGTYTRLDRRGITTGAGGPQTGSPGPAGKIDTTWGPGTGIGLIPATVLNDVGPVCASSASPGTVCTDTIWYRGLRPLTDPGLDPLPSGKTAANVRVDLLFHERAFWLFATGVRQGDLRRLMRQYQRPEVQTYPTGSYPSYIPSYGLEITAPIPPAERRNPLSTGCFDRGA